MNQRPRLIVAGIAAAGLVLIGAGSVRLTLTNSISVANPTIGFSRQATVTPDDIKPQLCGVQSLTALVAGGGGGTTVTGSSANALLLADGATQTIQGGSGNECLVGGTLTATLNGGGGTDVCIGPAGATFDASCEVVHHEP